jgi:hypothetical protein
MPAMSEPTLRNLPDPDGPGSCDHAPDWLSAERLGREGLPRTIRDHFGGKPRRVQDYRWHGACRKCGARFQWIVTSYDEA